MKRGMTEMTIPELQIEHKRMVAAIARLKDTSDETGKFQLASANALKFALECQLRGRAERLPAPTPLGENVLDFQQYKRKLEARKVS